MRSRLCLLLLAPFLMAADADPDPDPLEGRWLLTLPAGFKYEATLEPTKEAGLYRLKTGALNLQGVYELRGKALTMARPDNPNLAGLGWELRRNELVLTQQINLHKVGSDYRGAKLVRKARAGFRAPPP